MAVCSDQELPEVVREGFQANGTGQKASDVPLATL